MDAAAAAADDM